MSETEVAALPLETKADALAFLAAFDAVERREGSGGTHQPRPVNWKPLSVRCPEIFRAKAKAVSILGLNYWQIPYEEVIKRFEFRHLPRATWENKRRQEGLPV